LLAAVVGCCWLVLLAGVVGWCCWLLLVILLV
jgi:hypothetical protein